MKKVLFINSNRSWGGGEKWHLTTAMALKELGHQVSMITDRETALCQRCIANAITVDQLQISQASFLNPIARRRVQTILEKHRPDSVILNLPSDVKLCAPIAKKFGCRVIYRRGMPKNLTRNFLNKLIYPSVDIFVANSLEIKRSLLVNFPEWESKVQVITNGVDRTHPHSNKLSSPIVLGHLGRLVPQKGFHHLIQIAKILKEKEFSFKVLIGGSGELEEKIKKIIKEEKLEEHITLLGHVHAENFFPRIDLFTFTSEFEGSSNALIESLQYQVPAITFDISSMPEVIQDGHTGRLIKPFDYTSYAEAIIELTSNNEIYDQFKNNTHEVIQRKFLKSTKIEELRSIL